MKRLKCLAVALSLLTGFTLTSCLNGDSEPLEMRSAITKVNSSMGIYFYFTMPGRSATVTPTESSINSIEANNAGFSMMNLAGQIVQIQYGWNPDLLQIADDETDIQGVDLYSIQPLDAPTLIVPAAQVGTAHDSVATHPIIKLNPQVSGYTYKPFFFDDTKQDIVMPVSYYYPYDTRATAASLTLVYYPDDAATKSDKANNILRLYLNYRVRGVEEFTTQFPSYQLGTGAFYKTYRLGNILRYWGGTTPDEVNIVASENAYSTRLEDSQTEVNVYPVLTYEEYADEFYN